MTKELLLILKKTFPKGKIPKDFLKLKIGDLPQWDSLGNFNLLLAIEDFYKIRFTSEEMSEIKSVKQIINSLKKKKLNEKK